MSIDQLHTQTESAYCELLDAVRNAACGVAYKDAALAKVKTALNRLNRAHKAELAAVTSAEQAAAQSLQAAVDAAHEAQIARWLAADAKEAA